MRWRLVACAALALTGSVAGLAVWRVAWRANRAIRIATIETAEASKIAFTAAAVNPMIPAGMDPIATPAAFRDIAEYRGEIYLSGPSGLAVYSSDGTLLRRFRTGLELPPAELSTMSVGVSGGVAQLFIATHGAGILIFDGQRFRDIRPADAAHANATAVLALSTGRVLIGTEHGLLVYDGGSLTPFNEQLKTAYITALAGVEGDLWIGTLRGGAFHYHSGQLDSLASALPDPQVLSIALSDSAAYIGTPVGVVEFRDGQRTRTLADGYFATALAPDSRCLSVGTEDEGIAGVPLVPRGCVSTSQTIDRAIRHLAILGDAELALTDNAVYRFDNRSAEWKRVIDAAHGALTNRNISALAVDKNRRLWVGYFDKGLDIVDADFEHVNHIEDDHLFCVNRIVPAPAGDRTAVATANGLVLFDGFGTVRQVLGRKDGLMADHVTDVVFRPNQMIAATPAGLSFIDASGVRGLYVFQGLVNNHVYALAAAGDRLLVGTLGGISSVDNDTVRVNYDTANSGLRANWITAIVSAGGEWFAGTYGAGVFRLADSGRWEAFPDLKGGFIVNPNAMLVTSNRVYAGSMGRGLFVFDRASSRWTNVTRGLPSLNVTALASSGGDVYVGTDNGLVRFRAGALE